MEKSDARADNGQPADAEFELIYKGLGLDIFGKREHWKTIQERNWTQDWGSVGKQDSGLEDPSLKQDSGLVGKSNRKQDLIGKSSQKEDSGWAGNSSRKQDSGLVHQKSSRKQDLGLVGKSSQIQDSGSVRKRGTVPESILASAPTPASASAPGYRKLSQKQDSGPVCERKTVPVSTPSAPAPVPESVQDGQDESMEDNNADGVGAGVDVGVEAGVADKANPYGVTCVVARNGFNKLLRKAML